MITSRMIRGNQDRLSIISTIYRFTKECGIYVMCLVPLVMHLFKESPSFMCAAICLIYCLTADNFFNGISSGQNKRVFVLLNFGKIYQDYTSDNRGSLGSLKNTQTNEATYTESIDVLQSNAIIDEKYEDTNVSELSTSVIQAPSSCLNFGSDQSMRQTRKQASCKDAAIGSSLPSRSIQSRRTIPESDMQSSQKNNVRCQKTDSECRRTENDHEFTNLRIADRNEIETEHKSTENQTENIQDVADSSGSITCSSDESNENEFSPSGTVADDPVKGASSAEDNTRTVCHAAPSHTIQKVNDRQLDKNSFWVQANAKMLESEEIFSGLKDFFSTKMVKNPTEEQDVQAKELCIVLYPKSAQNLFPYDEIKRRLLKMDEEDLTPAIIEILIKYMPDADSMNQLAGLNDYYQELTGPEQFYVTISSIKKKLTPRLNSKMGFFERIDESNPLSNIKAQDGKTSLLHFRDNVIETKYQDVLYCLEEQGHIDKALEAFYENTLLQLPTDLKSLKKFLGDGDRFQYIMKLFIGSAMGQFDVLNTKYSLESSYKELRKFNAFDSHIYTTVELFQDIKSFKDFFGQRCLKYKIWKEKAVSVLPMNNGVEVKFRASVEFIALQNLPNVEMSAVDTFRTMQDLLEMYPNNQITLEKLYHQEDKQTNSQDGHQFFVRRFCSALSEQSQNSDTEELDSLFGVISAFATSSYSIQYKNINIGSTVNQAQIARLTELINSRVALLSEAESRNDKISQTYTSVIDREVMIMSACSELENIPLNRGLIQSILFNWDDFVKTIQTYSAAEDWEKISFKLAQYQLEYSFEKARGIRTKAEIKTLRTNVCDPRIFEEAMREAGIMPIRQQAENDDLLNYELYFPSGCRMVVAIPMHLSKDTKTKGKEIQRKT